MATEFERLSKLRVGQYIKILKEIPTWRNPLNLKPGDLVKYGGHKLDSLYKIISFNKLTATIALSPEDWQELPDSDNLEMLELLYKK